MDDTRIARPRSTVAVLVIAGAVLIGGVAMALPRVGTWLLGLPWVPFEGPIQLALRVADHVPTLLFALGGVILGAVLGAAAAHAEPVVTVSDREIVITRGSKRQRYARAQVDRTRVDGRRLSLRDADDVDLTELTVPGDPRELEAALRRHGWA